MVLTDGTGTYQWCSPMMVLSDGTHLTMVVAGTTMPTKGTRLSLCMYGRLDQNTNKLSSPLCVQMQSICQKRKMQVNAQKSTFKVKFNVKTKVHTSSTFRHDSAYSKYMEMTTSKGTGHRRAGRCLCACMSVVCRGVAAGLV